MNTKWTNVPTTNTDSQEWRSHWGSRGGRVPPTAKNLPKIGENEGEYQENTEKSGKRGKIEKALSLCSSWQIGLATLLTARHTDRQTDRQTDRSLVYRTHHTHVRLSHPGIERWNHTHTRFGCNHQSYIETSYQDISILSYPLLQLLSTVIKETRNYLIYQVL